MTDFIIEGEHTLVKTVVTAKIGGLAKFAKKMAKCLGCKAVLGKGYGKIALILLLLDPHLAEGSYDFGFARSSVRP